MGAGPPPADLGLYRATASIPCSCVRRTTSLACIATAAAFMAFASCGWAEPPPPRVSVKVAQSQKLKIEGGDFDDKLQRIAFDIAITNESLSNPGEGLSFEFYVFGQAVTQPGKLTLLQKERRDFSLEPRGTFTAETPEVQLQWDTTGAAFGDKYRGWVIRILDAEGKQMLQQTSSAFLTDTKNLPNLAVGSSFDKKCLPIGAPRR